MTLLSTRLTDPILARMNTKAQQTDLPQRMRRTIRTLLAHREESADDLATALGMHRSKLFRRFEQGKWTAEELDSLAKHFDVPIGVLFGDPNALLSGIRPGRRASDHAGPGGEMSATLPGALPDLVAA